MEERRVFYAIRLPSNKVLQYEIAPLLIRPVGRPPKRPVILYDDFWYRAGSWDRARRVVAKVEWYRGELFPRVGFIQEHYRRTPSLRKLADIHGVSRSTVHRIGQAQWSHTTSRPSHAPNVVLIVGTAPTIPRTRS